MANYLVTGGCGFIGSHLAESLLKDGHQIRILDDFSTGKMENVPPQCEVITGDVADSETVRYCMRDMDGCFHLAAIASVQQSNEEWVRTHQVNLTGTINVFDAAKEKRTPVVYASSAAVYGDNADIPLKESSAVSPLVAYGADKLGSELHARVASLVHGVPTTGMRFFNVYGPRQNPASSYSGVISIFVDRVMNHQALTIFGNGEQTRDFIYVGDVVRFLCVSMKNINRTPTVFNVCTGETVTINQLAKTVMSIMTLQVPVVYQSTRKGDIRVSVGDPGYAQQALGVTAKYTLAQGLQMFIDYSEAISFDAVQCRKSG